MAWQRRPHGSDTEPTRVEVGVNVMNTLLVTNRDHAASVPAGHCQRLMVAFETQASADAGTPTWTVGVPEMEAESGR
jgi:hypothetical protein